MYGMTELSHTDSDTPPQQHTASPYSLPVQYKGNSVTQTLPLHTEGDYDLVAPQNKPLDDDDDDDDDNAVYSEVNLDEASEMEGTNKTNSYYTQLDVQDETCAVYSVLENEEHKMYSTLS